MHYEKPELAEIKMDAEIGSYQNDFDPVDRVTPNVLPSSDTERREPELE